MRLDRFVREEHSEGVKISARVEWEGAHRGPEVMWFESDRRHAEGFDAAPEAFLLAAMPLAAGLGEPRLRIEGRACARLRDGLSAVMTTFATWYPWCRRVPIEASEGFASLSPRTPARVGAFFSGGVDSLSMVVANLRDHGPDDPARVHEAFHLFGWHSDDFDGRSPRAERVRVFEERHARLVTFAERAGLVLTPVRTNVRTFHPSFPWSRDVGFGPGMIAAAHAFRARVSAVLFASGGYPGAMPPHASHPDLDSLFSSGALAASHAEPDHTRLDKVIAIASRPEAMSVLEVCLHHDVPAPGVVNCGRCEKCVRTQLAFAAIGCLDAAVTFPDRDRLVEHLREVRISGTHAITYSAELLRGLAASGRPDLSSLLSRKIAAAERQVRRRGRWWRRLARKALHRG